MKILKQGDVNKLKAIKTFNCSSCGCLFEADNTEYKTVSNYYEEYNYIKCPCCGGVIYKEVY